MRCWWPSTSSPVRPEGTRLGSDGAATAGTQPEDRKVRGTVGGVPIGDGSGKAGLGDRADRFGPIHGKVLNRGLDLAEAAMG